MYKFSSPPFELFPTEEQKILIHKHNGCCRYVWNWALGLKNDNWDQEKAKPKEERNLLSSEDISKKLPALKKEKPWLTEVNAQSLVSKIRDLDKAFKRFYDNCKKKVKGKKGYPRFKKFNDQQSFQSQQSKKEKIVRCKKCERQKRSTSGCKDCMRQTLSWRQNRIEDFGDGWGLLYVLKFKNGISIRLHKKIEGSVETVTIKTTKTGRYFATICETREENLPNKPEISLERTLGIDDGLRRYITCDDGTFFENMKYLGKSIEKIKFLNKKLQKKRTRLFSTCQKCGFFKKGLKDAVKFWLCPKCNTERKLKDIYLSKKYNELRIKLAKIHEKVAWQRNDYINKCTCELTTNDNFDTIAIQRMNVSGLMKNRKLSRSIVDVSWSETYRQLKYKCNREGKNLIECDRFDATSKTCWTFLQDGSVCGYVKEDLTLADEKWNCPQCGANHDRDINAANGVKICSLIKVGVLKSDLRPPIRLKIKSQSC